MLMRAAASQFLVVDVQERLMPAVRDGERVLHNIGILLRACEHLAVPVLVSEQYPKGLGGTLARVAERLPEGSRRLSKTAFSAASEESIAAHVARGREAGRDQLVVCGAEAHICVLQSALGFRMQGYDVYVVADAVATRAEPSLQAACARLLHAGCHWVTTEMVLFELMERAANDTFRALSALIK